MSFDFLFPPFSADARGNKLESFEVRDHKGEKDEVLMLCGPEEVATQVISVSNGACKAKSLSDRGKQTWTHAFYFPEGVPNHVEDLCEALCDLLTIPSTPSIDVSMSLDWYKQPNDEGDLENTRAGRLINYTKYALYPQGSSSQKAWRELVDDMAATIDEHPMFSDAVAVSSPPGSAGDGTSFGERLGRSVAAKASKPFVSMSGPARDPQKEEVARDVRDDFELSKVVRGPIVLVDDVFHTGVTLESAGLAARRAGATGVMALTAARTLRK